MSHVDLAARAPDILDSHITYLNRVIDFIAGRIPDPQMTHFTRCLLGRWYHETAPHDPKFSRHPKLPELGRLHEAFHAACEQAVYAFVTSDKEKTDAAIGQALELSAEICEALNDILEL